MDINYFHSGKEWDAFLVEKGASFLQSYGWGEFKKNYQKVWRLEGREEGRIVAAVQVFEEKGPFYKYLYIPHGPVAENPRNREIILQEIEKKIGKNYAFLKIEPREEIEIGYRSLSRVQPAKTLVHNLSGKDFLQDFSKNTRYNVRLAKRKGVEIAKDDDFDAFYRILLKTKKKQGFSIYPKDYLELLSKTEDCALFLGKYKGKAVTGNMIYFFGDTATCLHSATLREAHKLKPANLLRYETMQYAREKGCKWFDSWGIDEKKFPGVTKFKKGFGGRVIKYPPGREIPIRKIKYFGHKAVSFVKSKRQ